MPDRRSGYMRRQHFLYIVLYFTSARLSEAQETNPNRMYPVWCHGTLWEASQPGVLTNTFSCLPRRTKQEDVMLMTAVKMSGPISAAINDTQIFCTKKRVRKMLKCRNWFATF